MRAATGGHGLARLDLLALLLRREEIKEDLRRLAARRADAATQWNLRQNLWQLHRLHDLQIGVGRIAVRADGTPHAGT